MATKKRSIIDDLRDSFTGLFSAPKTTTVSTPTTTKTTMPTNNWQLQKAIEKRNDPVAFEAKYPTVSSIPKINYSNPLTFAKEYGKEWGNTAKNYVTDYANPFGKNGIFGEKSIAENTKNIQDAGELYRTKVVDKVFGEGNNKLDSWKDVARFAANLPVGMVQAVGEAPKDYRELFTGKRLNLNKNNQYAGNKSQLTTAQRAGAGVNAFINTAGLATGGSGTLLRNVFGQSVKQLGKQGVKSALVGFFGDALKEGGEELVQSLAEDLQVNGGFDGDTINKALQSFALGTAGGAMMSGVGKAYGNVKSNVAPKIASSVLNSQRANIAIKNPIVTQPSYNLNLDEAGNINDFASYRMKEYAQGANDIPTINKLVSTAYPSARKAGMFDEIVNQAPIDAQYTANKYYNELLARQQSPDTKVRQLTQDEIRQQNIDERNKNKEVGSIANPFYTGDKTKITTKTIQDNHVKLAQSLDTVAPGSPEQGAIIEQMKANQQAKAEAEQAQVTKTEVPASQDIVNIDSNENAIRETASEYRTAKEYQDELTDLVWSNNKKGQGVEFINNENKYEPGFDIKRISNNTPFYRQFFAENGRKPTKGEIATLIDDYLNGKDNIMKYELAPEEVDVFNIIKENESAPLDVIEKSAPLSQPVDNIPEIAKQVTTKSQPKVTEPISSQRTVAPTIVESTKAVPVAKAPKSQSVLNKKAQSSDPIIAENDKISVTNNLESKYNDFEKSVYGDTTADITGGTKGASKYQQVVRGGKEKYNTAIQKGLSSENSAIRNISRGIRTLFGSAGDTAQRTLKKGEFRGGIDESINLANDFKKMGDNLLPDQASRERVWAVLDPELAGTKINESSLTPSETKAIQKLRQASDLINDENFKMGKISHETWLQGKDGKYITRAYEEYDIPTELKDTQMFTQPGKGKLDTGGYKARKDVDQWKQENAIKDPFYLASKRIQSTFRNKAITDYATWINKNADMVSDTPKAGYTQLSESPMWGELSGKNVRKDVLTDIKGFYSDGKALQGAYDMLNAYDKFKPRQVLKMTKTVLNPATRLGNQVSNRVFATLSGTNVAKFEYNMHKFAPQELANNGKYARLLRKEGILGTDSTKYDLAQSLVKDGADPSKIKQVMDKIKSSYGAADDKAKLAAFKSWIDSGKTVDEALIKVRNGFQDYSKVGLLYDIGAKMPLVGKPFIRFQSELARIVKNSITENPLRAVGTVGAIALMGELASRASGESPEDKETRENRYGTPVIPFTQIPLVFQTPIGEVNVARMFGMYETAGADTKNKNLIQRASKYLPFDIPTSKDELVKSLGNDVLLGGVANQVTDTDFRGKSISDPDSNKYQPSTLTDTEKNTNRLAALYHNYQLPLVNDVENLGRSILGIKDVYGRTKTPAQAASKLTGFKVEQFGPEQAAEQRAKDAVYADYDRKDLQSQINSVIKSQAKGEISEATANARIKGLQAKSGATQTGTESVNGVFKNPNGQFSYIDGNGDLKTVKTEEKAKQAITKMEFESSGENYLEKDGYVYTRDEDGDAKVTTKIKYDYNLNKATLTKLKNDDNLDGWLKQADLQARNIYEQMNNENISPIEKLSLENELNSLIGNISKYTSYGGFTKGSSKSDTTTKAEIAKILSILNSTRDTSNDTYKTLNSLLQGTRSYTKPSVQKVALKKITVKK